MHGWNVVRIGALIAGMKLGLRLEIYHTDMSLQWMGTAYLVSVGVFTINFAGIRSIEHCYGV
jgi:hypothetical protein